MLFYYGEHFSAADVAQIFKATHIVTLIDANTF